MSPQRKSPAMPGGPASLPPVKQLESSSLLGAAGEVQIRHAGRLYRLRRTRHGKLILTA
jgi:hemin uptake protein HemP